MVYFIMSEYGKRKNAPLLEEGKKLQEEIEKQNQILKKIELISDLVDAHNTFVIYREDAQTRPIEIKKSLDVLNNELLECIEGNALSNSKGKEYAELIEDGNFLQALKILAIEKVILAEEAKLFPLE